MQLAAARGAAVAVGSGVLAAVKSLGLADVLLGGGFVLLTVGLVALCGWPVALVVDGILALAGGVAVVRAEGGRK